MENHNKHDVHEVKFSGTWIELTVGDEIFLGRIKSLLGPDGRKTIENEVPVDEVLDARNVELFPVYDVFKPMMNGPEGFARPTIIVPHGAAMHAYPIHVALGAGVRVSFVSQMHTDDKERYEEGCTKSRKGQEESTAKARAKKSGLVLPDSPGFGRG